MPISLSRKQVEATTCDSLRYVRSSFGHHYSRDDIEIDEDRLEDAALKEVQAIVAADGNTKQAKVIMAILDARCGKISGVIPSFGAFYGMLKAYLSANVIDGWIYVKGSDGKFYPELVTAIDHDSEGRGSDKRHFVSIRTMYFGKGDGEGKLRTCQSCHRFYPEAASRKRMEVALADAGITKETPDLKASYMGEMERHNLLASDPATFARQFRASGVSLGSDSWRASKRDLQNAKVIWDVPASEQPKISAHDCPILEVDAQGVVPVHPITRVFDLIKHEFQVINTAFLTPYVYDKTLGEKIVLPASHRDLLDVLTSDIDSLTSDIIEGKSAGNVILCKGIPGVGKTLTAEVYAELIERPLYKIQTGQLGTTAEAIEKSLEEIFKRGKRWGCVLLLDEADVFVCQRGGNIEQNAIVAEFLRTLEYFDGLLFMTTNRSDDIDEAIVSRCAAIIGYEPPAPANAARVWRVMAKQFDTDLSGELVDGLVKLFPRITPRDIKMLLRLVLRVSAARNEALSLDLFRRYAMFRAIEMAQDSA